MKNLLLSLFFLAFVFEISAQSFTKRQVYDNSTITGQNNKSKLFDYDGDGDDDVLAYGATNDNRILVFENNNGAFDSSFVFYEGAIGDITLIDFDSDGDLDIVGLENIQGGILKFENLGSGNFELTTQNSLLSSMPLNIDNADIDNDGLPDLVYSTFNPREVRWVKNLGGGDFASSHTVIAALSDRVRYFKMADLDNDGDVDVITQYDQGASGQRTATSINDGNGNFNTTLAFPSGLFTGLRRFTLGDFNGDSLIDFAYVLQSEVKIRWGDNTNIFGSETTIKDYPLGTSTRNIGKFDLDGDNDLDLLIGVRPSFSGTMGDIMINDGNGNFIEHTEKINAALWGSLEDDEMFFSDFDADGNVDVLTNSISDSDIIIHYQDNNASFTERSYLNHYFTNINNFQVLDFNNDGILDLVTVDEKSTGKLEVAYGNSSNEFEDSEVIIDNKLSRGNLGSKLVLWNDNDDYDLIYSSSNQVFLYLDFKTPNATTILLYTQNPGADTGAIGISNMRTELFQVGDIDNDGDIDLMIPVNGVWLQWIENTGGQNFTSHTLSTNFQRYLLTDLDNDGDLDFIGQKNNSSEYLFFEMDHITKSFTNYLTLNVPASVPHQFAAGDIDNDGDQDIVISGLKWMENDGSGIFSAPVDLVGANLNYNTDIVVDDIDNDGLDDIVVNNANQGVTAFLNQDNNVFTPVTEGLDATATFSALKTADLNGNGFKSIIVGSREGVTLTPLIFDFCINTENTVDIDVCSGDSYTLADGTVISDITVSDTYVTTLSGQAANGCDVIVTENINVQSVSDTSTSVSDETITANNPNASYVWLDCDNSFAVIPGETNQSFTAIENGNYAVEITENGCSEISDCVAITTLSLEDNNFSNQVKIYPNPTAGNLNIQLGNNYDEVQILVRNILGQHIMSKTYSATREININLETTSGIYFVEITTGNKRAVSKVIKQ